MGVGLHARRGRTPTLIVLDVDGVNVTDAPLEVWARSDRRGTWAGSLTPPCRLLLRRIVEHPAAAGLTRSGRTGGAGATSLSSVGDRLQQRAQSWRNLTGHSV